MDNFDLKKFLVENKLTNNSKLLREQEEISPEEEAKLKDRAEDLVKSPKVEKIVKDMLDKMSQSEIDKLMSLANGVNEDISESRVLAIASRIENLEEGVNPAAAFMGAISQLTLAGGLIQGMLLGGGPAALAVVGPPVAAVLALAVIVTVAEQIIQYAYSKRKPTNHNPENRGLNRSDQID